MDNKADNNKAGTTIPTVFGEPAPAVVYLGAVPEGSTEAKIGAWLEEQAADARRRAAAEKIKS